MRLKSKFLSACIAGTLAVTQLAMSAPMAMMYTVSAAAAENISKDTTLKDNMTVNGDLIVSAYLNLNGYTLTVKGSVTVKQGYILVGSGTLNVSGDINTVETGYINMSDEGTVNLSGDLNLNSKDYCRMYHGVLNIGGDLHANRIKDGDDYKGGFDGGYTHVTRFTGDAVHTVSFKGGNSYNHMKYVEADKDSVLFLTDETSGFTVNSDLKLADGSNINNGSYDLNIIDGHTVTALGDFTLESGMISLNDFVERNEDGEETRRKDAVFKVNGDLTVSGGYMLVNDGTVDVDGSIYVQGDKKGSLGSGFINMSDEKSIVNVGKDFVIYSKDYCRMYHGILSIGGDLRSRRYVDENGDGFGGFDGAYSHVIRFTGDEVHTVSFKGDNSYNHMKYVEADKDSVLFLTDETSGFTVNSDLKLADGSNINNGSYDLNIIDGHTVTALGDFTLESGMISLNDLVERNEDGEETKRKDAVFNVNGDLTVSGGYILVNDGTVDVDGSIYVQGDKKGSLGSGFINMSDEKSIVNVGKDFVIYSKDYCRMYHGILSIGGDLRSRRYVDENGDGFGGFDGAYSHVIRFTGDAVHTVSFKGGHSYNHMKTVEADKDSVLFLTDETSGFTVNSDLKLADGSNINKGSYDLNIIDGHTVTALGDFTLESGMISLNDFVERDEDGNETGRTDAVFNVNGDLTVSGGYMLVNDGTVNVAGNINVNGDGYINMSDDKSIVNVAGDFTQNSRDYSRMYNGTLSIGGDLTANRVKNEDGKYLGGFDGGYSHFTEFYGSGTHNVTFNYDTSYNKINGIKLALGNSIKFTGDLIGGYTDVDSLRVLAEELASVSGMVVKATSKGEGTIKFMRGSGSAGDEVFIVGEASVTKPVKTEEPEKTTKTTTVSDKTTTSKTTTTTTTKTTAATKADTTVTFDEDEDIVTGKCGDDAEFIYGRKSCQMIISGKGGIWDEAANTAWSDFYDEIKSVFINDGITAIGREAFYDCLDLDHVMIPDSVTEIHDDAFTGTAVFNAQKGSIKYIDGWAVDSTDSITEADIEDGTRGIAEYAFYYRKKLTSAAIPGSVRYIDSSAFHGCGALVSVTIANGVEYIATAAFMNTAVTEISVPKSVKTIDELAFAGCAKLEKITIYDPEAEILGGDGTICNKTDDNACVFDGTIYGYRNSTAQIYADTYGYKFVALDGEPEEDDPFSDNRCGAKAYWKFDEKTGTLTIYGEGNMYQFGDNAESNYKAYGTRPWDDTLLDIKKVVIEDNVRFIGSNSFKGCKNLSSVSISDSVYIIDADAFKDTKILDSQSDELIRYVDGWAVESAENIKAAELADGARGIGANTFRGREKLTTAVIPGTVQTIGHSVFADCKALTSLTIEDGVKTICGGAFRNCDSLETVDLPASVSYLAGVTNFVSSKLTSITVRDPECTFEEYSAVICNDYKTDKEGNVFGTYNGVIRGYKNSTAQAYAEKYGYKFEALDGEAVTTTVTTDKDGKTSKTTSTTTVITDEDDETTKTSKTTVATDEGEETTKTAKTSVTTKPSKTTEPDETDKPEKTTTTEVEVVSIGSFDWGKDNWSFANTDDNFTDGSYMMMSKYLDALRAKLTNKEYYNVLKHMAYEWEGSCYGMSVIVALIKNGLDVKYTDYTKGAECLHDLSTPEKSEKVKSLINYYMLLQMKDSIQQKYRQTYFKTNKQNIRSIVSQIENEMTVLVGYGMEGWGAHAAVAYGLSEGLWKINGTEYDRRIDVYDPDVTEDDMGSVCIYFDSESFEWTIPYYAKGKLGSENGAYFLMTLSDNELLNEDGFINGTESKSQNDFIPFIKAPKGSKIIKLTKTDNGYKEVKAKDGEIVAFTKYAVSGGTANAEEGSLVKDSKAAYKIIPAGGDITEVAVDFEGCLLSADAGEEAAVIFDPSGAIEVQGASDKLSMKMVCNDVDTEDDWYTIEVTGDGKSDVTLEKTDKGFVLAGDDLTGLTVRANNDDSEAETEIKSGSDAVLITQNEGDIAVKKDSDGDGEFDKDITDGEEAGLEGDANGDGKVNVRDAAFIAAKLSQGKAADLPANADFNGDGKVNVRDAASIAKFLATGKK